MKVSNAGHLFGELMEVDEAGKTIAKIQVMIWDNDLQLIQQKLKQHGLSLTDSQEICALAGVSFHEVFGLRLHIFDVDPSFGESHVERNRRIVLERLTREGLVDRNRALPFPVAPLRIGLLAASGSAALADFRQTILNSQFAFRIVHASIQVQGEVTAQSVIAALEQLSRLSVDLICLVRGGGSQTDLAWLDDEAIARAVATCPIPVWVGIGHEIDRGVLDVIAHSSHKTPTEVANVLVSQIRNLSTRLETADDRLRESCDRLALLTDQSLDRMATGLLQGSRKHAEKGQRQCSTERPSKSSRHVVPDWRAKKSYEFSAVRRFVSDLVKLSLKLLTVDVQEVSPPERMLLVEP